MNLIARTSLVGAFLVMAFILQSGTASAQSRDINNPTPIASFPVTGTLGSGTYYYQIPEAMVTTGRANLVLDFTPPDGGASMTVTLSGRRCCPPEAYIGVTTGLADRLRESTAFEIPGPQDLLVTIYISAGAKQTAGYRINFNMGAAGSGIIVTPPTPTPTTPTSPSAPVCTDLGLNGFTVISLSGRRKKIGGDIYNVTATHPYKGYARRQWIEVRDITDSETRPRIVARIFIPEIIDPGRSFPFATVDTVTERRRTRYELRIGYSHLNAADESPYNDDCNTRNNLTRRELTGPFPEEDNTVRELEQLPEPKSKP